MFYVRTQLNKETFLKLGIHKNNVFTRCPRCGREIAVDLAEVFIDAEGDLDSTTVLCAKCCEKLHEGDWL